MRSLSCVASRDAEQYLVLKGRISTSHQLAGFSSPLSTVAKGYCTTAYTSPPRWLSPSRDSIATGRPKALCSRRSRRASCLARRPDAASAPGGSARTRPLAAHRAAAKAIGRIQRLMGMGVGVSIGRDFHQRPRVSKRKHPAGRGVFQEKENFSGQVGGPLEGLVVLGSLGSGRQSVARQAPHLVLLAGAAGHLRVRAFHHLEVVFVSHGAKLLLSIARSSVLHRAAVALSEYSYVTRS